MELELVQSRFAEKENINLVKDVYNNLFLEKFYPHCNSEAIINLKNHPNSGYPRIFDFHENEHGYVLIEELVQGRTLTQIMNEYGLFPPYQAGGLIIKICECLKQIHDLNIIHGDVKPDNIIVTFNDEVKLIDFNASKKVVKNGGRDTVLLGTPGFAAPEQYGFMRSDFRSDIYAVGVLLNLLITGCNINETRAAGRISYIIDKCTRMNPEERYSSVEELINDMNVFLHTRRKPGRPGLMIPGFRTRKPWKMIIACLYYGLAVLIAVLMTLEGQNRMELLIGFKIGMFAEMVLPALIICNYRNIQFFFPFAKKNTGYRVLSAFLECLMSTTFVLIYYIIISFIWG